MIFFVKSEVNLFSSFPTHVFYLYLITDGYLIHLILFQTMLDKEKKRFHEMAENDKKRYDTEMQSYTPPKGEKQRGKKRKQVKDPNAPKRSL